MVEMIKIVIGEDMEIIFYLLLLLINQVFVFLFMGVADFKLKLKYYKTIKCSKIVFRATRLEKDRVSRRVFFFQILNYIYILTYIILASIDVFAIESYILFAICAYSAIAYTIAAFLSLVFATIW